MGFLQNIAKVLAEHSPSASALLSAGSEPQGIFLVLFPQDCSGNDSRDILEKMLQVLDGRGGGSGRIRQGIAARLDQRAQALPFLHSLFKS